MPRTVKVRVTRALLFTDEFTLVNIPDKTGDAVADEIALDRYAYNAFKFDADPNKTVIIGEHDDVVVLLDSKMPDKEVNTNCLEGMKCPDCGHRKSFRIEITSTFDVEDDGIENNGDTEWNDKSPCECKSCGYSGIVEGFRVKA